jgi:cell division septation protein DedD
MALLLALLTLAACAGGAADTLAPESTLPLPAAEVAAPATAAATATNTIEAVAAAVADTPTAEPSATESPSEDPPAESTAIVLPTDEPTATAVPTAEPATLTPVVDRPDKALPEEQRWVLEGLENLGPAPELNNEVWLNSEPLKLADLRGQVVLLDMWTFG